MFRRFLFSRIWSSAQDHAVLALLLNLFSLSICWFFHFHLTESVSWKWFVLAVYQQKIASRRGRTLIIFTWFIGAGGLILSLLDLNGIILEDTRRQTRVASRSPQRHEGWSTTELIEPSLMTSLVSQRSNGSRNTTSTYLDLCMEIETKVQRTNGAIIERSTLKRNRSLDDLLLQDGRGVDSPCVLEEDSYNTAKAQSRALEKPPTHQASESESGDNFTSVMSPITSIPCNASSWAHVCPSGASKMAVASVPALSTWRAPRASSFNLNSNIPCKPSATPAETGNSRSEPLHSASPDSANAAHLQFGPTVACTQYAQHTDNV